MYEQVKKSKENKSRTVANSVVQKKSNVKKVFGFVDNRKREIPKNGSEPVFQRMKIGTFDTEDPSAQNGVISELKKLNITGLYNATSILMKENTTKAKWYINWIEGRLTKLQYDEVTSSENIKVSVLISIDGIPFASTKTYTAGNNFNKVKNFSFPPTPLRNKVDDEYQISQRDAESGALDEAYNIIKEEFPIDRHYQKGVSIVKFTVIGTYGPCDGCKDRIEYLRQLTEKRIALAIGEFGVPVVIDEIYRNKPLDKSRGRENIPTTYGSHSDIQAPVLGFTNDITLPKPQLDPNKPLDQSVSYLNSSSFPYTNVSIREEPSFFDKKKKSENDIDEEF